jgi:opacity protein-like surface antigen
MTRLILVAVAVVATAAFAAPAMAGWEATQEPGAVGFNYPDSHYLTGGYGVRASPGPGFYFRHPAPRAMYVMPVPAYGYGYYYGGYGGPVGPTYWGEP